MLSLHGAIRMRLGVVSMFGALHSNPLPWCMSGRYPSPAGVRAGRPQALRGGEGAGRGRHERGGPEETQQEQEAGEEAGCAPKMLPYRPPLSVRGSEVWVGIDMPAEARLSCWIPAVQRLRLPPGSKTIL